MSSFASYPELQPKLDVLGIGVYLGFGALAHLILFFVLLLISLTTRAFLNPLTACVQKL